MGFKEQECVFCWGGGRENDKQTNNNKKLNKQNKLKPKKQNKQQANKQKQNQNKIKKKNTTKSQIPTPNT